MSKPPRGRGKRSHAALPYNAKMNSSFKDNVDFKLGQQNFKLSDLNADSKALLRLKVQLKARKSCEQPVFQRNRLSPLASAQAPRPCIDLARVSSSPCSLSVSPPAFWKQYGGQESGVRLLLRLCYALTINFH